ncbi:MAG: hypothetical protein JKY93_08470 [Gammaproteobacteria bacterium]|nr:hypothetical protein [Gammaproteobacteria bacterium]
MLKNSLPYKSTSSLVYKAKFKWRFLWPQYWSTWLILAVLFLINLLPNKFIDRLANLLGDVLRKKHRKRFNIANTNIRRCFSGLDETEYQELLKQHFRALVRSILHYGFIFWGSDKQLKQRIQLIGEEHIEYSRKQGKAIIIMIIHSVGLEAGVLAVSRYSQISGPFKAMANPVINWMVARARQRFNAMTYTREMGLRPIIKDVKAGCVMCYLPDEDLGRDRSIFVPLLGIKKATIPVLGRLAKTCNADVLPCVACYDITTAQYQVRVLPALQEFPAGDDYQDTLRMNQSIEELIGICPEQYFWTLRLFKTRPQDEVDRGEPEFYG